MTDHEIDLHKNLAEFTESNFLNKGREKENIIDHLADAMSMLNSFGKLDYGFYEIFKPIGGGNGKYIKVKMSTDGYVDISGVVGLSDCIHWNWEYGSDAYLRSLNTGNQRYLLQLDMPFNDKNSTLWWKPDNPEKANLDPPEDEDGNPLPTTLNYKAYETERFLRWYGNDHIPHIDESTLEKCTVCSSPSLSNDTESDTFHSDSRNLGNMDLTRTNIDASTSLSLLSLYPKATIALRTYVEEKDDKGNVTFGTPTTEPEDATHQYLEFVVTGNRQTTNLSFNIRGRIEQAIQEANHYLSTINRMEKTLNTVFETRLFFEVSCTAFPELKTIWEQMDVSVTQGEDWVPDEWHFLEDKLGTLLNSPNVVDLLRFRQLDTEIILSHVELQNSRRVEFLEELDDDFIKTHCKGDLATAEELSSLINGEKYLGDDGRLVCLKNYVDKYKTENSEDLEECYYNIGNLLTSSQCETLVKTPLEQMYGKKDEETPDAKDPFSDVTVDILRERITTFNNLIVRLPVDTEHNCLASKHIWQDWKAFVDGAANYLNSRGELTFDGKVGLGSDEKEHPFKEYLVNGVPLVDYSWLYASDPTNPYLDDKGKPIGDRFDYWDKNDFKWPQ